VSPRLALLAFAVSGCVPSLDDPGRFDAATENAASDDGGGMPVAISDGGVCPDMPRLLATTCTGSLCHNPSDKAQGLDLQSPDVASRLLGVTATEGPGLLADPSAPSASILYLKVTAHPPFGARMPLGQMPLPASTAECVLEWIASGAMQAASSGDDEDAAAAADATPAPPGAEGGMSCETSMDSYGYMRCACLAGQADPANAVAACTGYDCCVRYRPDSGLAEGFGNPSASSNLCACYAAADIAALFGAPTTCQRFAGGSHGTIVQSCP
jgi:hypothetical protein